jgi:phosphotransferase system enzyme I (PtsI)
MGERLQSNPALGLRAIRVSLAEPKMFQTQLRAILRASKYGKIKLLIPMLSQAHEIDADAGSGRARQVESARRTYSIR